MRKIFILLKDYIHTSVVSGSRIDFFFFYWRVKLWTFFRRVFHSTMIDTMSEKSYFIIKNSVGTFMIPRTHDDTLTICSEYFESHLMHWLDKPPKKRTLIDIGANRGRYTILGLLSYNYSHAYAFEPFPQTIDVLIKNISLNELDKQVSIMSFALGAREESAEIYVDTAHLGGAAIQDTSIAGSTKSHTTIQVKTLDSCITPEIAQTIDFIKIDTEGYEKDVLLGATTTLSLLSSGAHLMIETENQDEIANFLSDFNIVVLERIKSDSLFVKK